MQVQRDDIALVAKLRRDCAFPLRLVRGSLVIMIAAMGGLLVVVLMSRPSALVLTIAILISGTLLLLAFGVAKGSRAACVLVAACFLVLVLTDFYRLAADILFGFPKFDLASLRGLSNELELKQAVDNGLLRNPLLLPLRLYTLLFDLALLYMVWQPAKLHVLPSCRVARPFKRFIFVSPGSLSALFRLFRSSPMTRRISLRPIGAVAAYLAYLFFLCWTVTVAYSLAGREVQAQLALGLSHATDEVWQVILGQLILLAVFFVYSTAMFGISRFFLTRAKRLAATTAEVLRSIDQRPPVLYLRSFRNDLLPAQEHADQGITRFLDPYRESAKLEELVVARATAVGPAIAIGDPKTPIQSTGAARLWAGDAQWQDTVTALMHDAALIIVLMDLTENLRWEVETLTQRRLLERTVFVFPPQADDDAGNAEKMIGMLCELDIISGPDAAAMLGKPEEIRALMTRGGKLRVLTSRSATYSDYDIALRIMLHELAAPAAARERPLAHLDASGAAVQS